jgi:L-alanine-DL-glutamate epimerase-like enolase superfamily enzyme
MTSVRNTNFYELGLVHPGVKTNRPPVYIDYSDDLDSEGNVHAPDGPGIGVDLDWDYIRKHEVDNVVLE